MRYQVNLKKDLLQEISVQGSHQCSNKLLRKVEYV